MLGAVQSAPTRGIEEDYAAPGAAPYDDPLESKCSISCNLYPGRASAKARYSFHNLATSAPPLQLGARGSQSPALTSVAHEMPRRQPPAQLRRAGLRQHAGHRHEQVHGRGGMSAPLGVAEARADPRLSGVHRHQETAMPAMPPHRGMLRAAGKFSTQVDPSYVSASQAALLREVYPESVSARRFARYHNLPGSASSPSGGELRPSASEPRVRRALPGSRSLSPTHSLAQSVASSRPARSSRGARGKLDDDEMSLDFPEQLCRKLAELPGFPPQVLSLMRRGEWGVNVGMQ